ncbi:MAG TPA: hypothetical protein VGS27_29155 [Candidatus Sulfotelmatobacter sp.]|nr:hypothetical protein [Candidatus Sulfotelmatobacter sp.]
MESNSATFDPESIRNEDVSYEPRDLSHRAVFAFLVTLGLAICMTLIVLWGVFRYLGGSQFAGHQTTNPIMTSNEQLKEVGGDPALAFPLPRLQPNDIADLNKFRVSEEEQLNSYGWVDRSQQKIHIPIERAIDMLGTAWPQQQETLSTETVETDHPQSQGGIQTGKGMRDEREGNYGW